MRSPNPEKYARLVSDPDYLVAFGVGETYGDLWDASHAPAILCYSKADLGMEPYRSAYGPLGWSVSFLRRPQEGEPHTPGYYRHPLPPEQIVEHIPGTRYL